ncbi:MAG: succinyl-diaminopimelate desuccinylase [Gammaproteobacteria bacterium]|nr:succinyl-diaminopimelate desuccinylase [Gammaproteobacteria bacterium]
MNNIDDSVLKLTQKLIRRPSITPKDEGCQRLICDILDPLDFQVEHLRFGEVDNLWVRHGNGHPVLCFAGHTDVVPPGSLDEWISDPFAAEVHDGRLVARGAADMKSGLAAMVFACRRFVENYPNHNGSIALLITSDEEGEARDGTYRVMETLSKRKETIDWCIVGEPSSSKKLGDTVRIGRRGSLTGLMTLRGIQGHVAYPAEARNPIHDLANLVHEINRKPIDNGTKHFPPTSFQMVNVHSDAGAPNVVPGELKCRFNFRYSTKWTQESLSSHIENLALGLGIDCDITWRNAGNPFFTQEGRLSNALSTAINEHTGINPELSTSGGTSDGRFIAPHGVDIVEFGPLNKTIHKVNEEVLIDDIPKLADIYYRTAELLLEKNHEAKTLESIDD